ncbi:hypothetical protein SESBI_20384 [Sesbania bispinosa]|nr:hypothetical protein SESBI_20384 [Sesbania bispinosa]
MSPNRVQPSLCPTREREATIRRRINLNFVLDLDLDSAFVAVQRGACEGKGMSFASFRSSLPFSGLIRQLEQEMETVIKVLQPGPLGIIEHKFSADEIHRANTTVSKAVANWRRNATLEDKNHILKDYIHK